MTGVCPRCTYANHPELWECEMCGAILEGGGGKEVVNRSVDDQKFSYENVRRDVDRYFDEEDFDHHQDEHHHQQQHHQQQHPQQQPLSQSSAQPIHNWYKGDSQTFYRTKKLAKVVREQHIRTDIKCGVVGCKKCPAQPHAAILKTANHILVVDSAVLLGFLEVIEVSCKRGGSGCGCGCVGSNGCGCGMVFLPRCSDALCYYHFIWLYSQVAKWSNIIFLRSVLNMLKRPTILRR
jgi:hypothetical protein